MSRRAERQLEYERCVIKPGYLAISPAPSVIFSVCGCGVVIVLRDRIKRVGGLAFCLFPRPRWGQKRTNYFADVAVTSLVKSLLGCDCYPEDMEAQLFGGASLNPWQRHRAAKVVKACRKTLQQFRINIASEDVGGNLGRKIVFNTHSGETAVLKTRKIRKSDWVPELAMAE